MAHAYTPGLTVTPRKSYRARRVLPIPGEVLVEVGQQVTSRDVVARTEMPGDVTPLNMANLLSVPPGDVPACMLVKEGDRVEVGQPLARTKGLFGLFKTEYKSRVAGTVESISSVTGQVMIRGEPIRVETRAYISGTVAEVLPNEGVVVEAEVSLIQGIFGIAGEAFGKIRMACADHEQELTEDLIHADMAGCVVIGGARVTASAVRRAVDIGAAALVTGGIDDQDLRDFLGYDLGVAITGSEKVGLTLIITEGFGEISMAKRTFALFAAREGADASVNGATQIRAGVMRPEVVIPVDANTPLPESPGGPSGKLDIGTQVRVIRDPYFGLIGEVADLPPEPQVLESESKARVLVVRFESGREATIPRANVELIEG